MTIFSSADFLFSSICFLINLLFKLSSSSLVSSPAIFPIFNTVSIFPMFFPRLKKWSNAVLWKSTNFPWDFANSDASRQSLEFVTKPGSLISVLSRSVISFRVLARCLLLCDFFLFGPFVDLQCKPLQVGIFHCRCDSFICRLDALFGKIEANL